MTASQLFVHEKYMQRCIELARLGAGTTAPNPMVGSVLVHNGRIIGEGWHQLYGGAHAEVHCIASVPQAYRHLIPASTIYVSLEPCAHFGKTPPCADLIIANNIKQAVIGCRDPFEAVNGKGIEKLQASGIMVTVGVLETACRELNNSFFTFHTKKRPYVILKWAESADGFMAGAGNERTLISNAYTNRLVHKWRSETAAILVGTNTALKDDPALTTRWWPGNNPVRLVLDKQLRLPASLKMFDGSVATVVFNQIKSERANNTTWYKITGNNVAEEILAALYALQLNSLLVEGGAALLQSFIDAGLFDEIRIIKNTQLFLQGGMAAPVLRHVRLARQQKTASDTVSYLHPLHQ